MKIKKQMNKEKVFTKVFGRIIKEMVSVCSNGHQDEFMQETGFKTKSRAVENLYLNKVQNTVEHLLKINVKVMAITNGQITEDLKVGGTRINNTGSVCILAQMYLLINLVFGKWVKE